MNSMSKTINYYYYSCYFCSDRNCFNCDIVARYAQYLDSLLPSSESSGQPGKFRLFLITVFLIQFLMILS